MTIVLSIMEKQVDGLHIDWLSFFFFLLSRKLYSFDKQYLRNYLDSIGFDRGAGITLPEDVIVNTMAKYQEAYKLLTGKDATHL